MQQTCEITAKRGRFLGVASGWRFVAVAADGRPVAESGEFPSGLLQPAATDRVRGHLRALVSRLEGEGWSVAARPDALRGGDWWATSLVRDSGHR